MNRLIQIILFFFFGVQIIIGQSGYNEIGKWDKIMIRETHGSFQFDYKYQIKKENFQLTLIDKPDSIIKKVDSKLIFDIIYLLNRKNDSVSSKKTLSYFGKDSLWLEQNAENLWKEYSIFRETSKEIDSIAINTIKDTRITNEAAWYLQDEYITDRTSIVDIQFINENDTLRVLSCGRYPFMLPWYIKERKVYDYRVSELISKLLPCKVPGNNERLSGKGFNYHLIDKVYRAYIKDKENYIESRKKYLSDFKLLEKEFEIKKAEIADMSSIEWEGGIDTLCLEMSLKDSTISNNIEFYTIFEIGKHLKSPRTIIDNKDELINSLSDNPIYKYTLSCDNCIGEIHWVKSRTLSKKAINSFKRYLKFNGIDKNKYNGRYKNAFFYELTEFRDSEKSFSRWIFLQDGTLIL